MALRFYFTELRGAGTEADPYRCPLADYRINDGPYDFLDMRPYQEIDDGFLFAWADDTAIDHAIAITQTDVHYLPFERANGNLVGLDEAVSNVASAKRTAILADLEARHVPTDDLTGTNTVRQVVRRILGRCRLMELLMYIDMRDIALTDTLASIDPIRRKAILRRLTNRGFSLSGVDTSTTVRQALKALIAQNVIEVPV